MNKTTNILIITHWSYRDALIQTYTLPYLRIIRNYIKQKQEIILVTSEQKSIGLTKLEETQIKKNLEEENIILVTQPYRKMGFLKIIYLILHLVNLIKIIKKNKVSTIHCFCTPAGSIGYLLSVITGAKLIIDSYEPHAESMVENNTWKKNGLPFRILFLFEKLQSYRAKCLIATTSSMEAYAKKKYGVVPNVFYVKPACVNLNLFNLQTKDTRLLEELGLSDMIVCVYSGKLGGIYLNEEVFDFIKQCYVFWGNKFRFLLLTNSPKDHVHKQVVRVNLPEHVTIQKYVQFDQISRYLSLADFAINFVNPVSTKKHCTSIKDGEYWASGLPIVITKNISDDSEIIRNSGFGYELQRLDLSEYKLAILAINSLINGDINSLRKNIRKIAIRYRDYEIAEKIYEEIYS